MFQFCSATVSIKKQAVATVDDIPVAAYKVVEEAKMLVVSEKYSMHVSISVFCDLSKNAIVPDVSHVLTIYGVAVEKSVEEY